MSISEWHPSSMSHKITTCSYAQLLAFLVTNRLKIYTSFFLPTFIREFCRVHNLLVKTLSQDYQWTPLSIFKIASFLEREKSNRYLGTSDPINSVHIVRTPTWRKFGVLHYKFLLFGFDNTMFISNRRIKVFCILLKQLS